MVCRRIEGQAAEIRGDRVVRDEKPNRRRGKHKGQVIAAEGSVEVEITKQYPASKDSETRPPAGTVLKADRATVNARWSGKVSPDEGRGGKRRCVRVDKGFDAILNSYRSRRSGRRAPTPSCSMSSHRCDRRRMDGIQTIRGIIVR